MRSSTAAATAVLIHAAAVLLLVSQAAAAESRLEAPFSRNARGVVFIDCKNGWICADYDKEDVQPPSDGQRQFIYRDGWTAITNAYGLCNGGMGPCSRSARWFDMHTNEMKVHTAYKDVANGNREWALLADVNLSCDGHSKYTKQVLARLSDNQLGCNYPTTTDLPCAPDGEPANIQIADGC